MVGVIFFGLLPLPGLLGVTAFLFGLVIVLVIHSRRGQPWRSVLVRAGLGLALMWLAVAATSVALLDRFTSGDSSGGAAGPGPDTGRLLLMVGVAAMLLLALAGGLLAWIAAASRPRATVAPSNAAPDAGARAGALER